jgi:hypothetical protein
MDRTKRLNHRFASVGWGLLFIWWGVVIMVDPLTVGMGAIGTGLILLGINAGRSWMDVPIRDSTTTWGIIFLAWGALDVARSLYHCVVTNIHDVITFQGGNESDLRQEFVDSIEDYLEFCKTRGEKSEKPHPSRSGSATALDQR